MLVAIVAAAAAAAATATGACVLNSWNFNMHGESLIHVTYTYFQVAIMCCQYVLY
jgi:hypothetical protein